MSPIKLTSSLFDQFRAASNRAKNVTPFVGTVLSLDPGETTGYAIFHTDGEYTELYSAGQIKTWPFQETIKGLEEVFTEAFPVSQYMDEQTAKGRNLVLFESYNIYAHKLERHTHSNVPTLQIIGVIQTFCFQRGLQPINQTAQIGKGFAKDEKLRTWGFYLPGLKHARDATRHGCYFLLFGNKEIS